MTEALWRRVFVFGLAIGLPVGALILIVGLVLGFLGYTWVILWIAFGVIVLSVLLILYAVLAPVVRLATGMKQFRRHFLLEQMAGKISSQNNYRDQTTLAEGSESEHEKALADTWEAIAQIKTRRQWGISSQLFLALVKEFKGLEVTYDPPRKQMTQAELDVLFNAIAKSQLTLIGKAVADFGLLAVLEGSVPSEDALSCLRSVFGDEFVEATLSKK